MIMERSVVTDNSSMAVKQADIVLLLNCASYATPSNGEQSLHCISKCIQKSCWMPSWWQTISYSGPCSNIMFFKVSTADRDHILIDRWLSEIIVSDLEWIKAPIFWEACLGCTY